MEPSPADERETAYDLLQRGEELLRRRHHAQAAIVLERANRLEPHRQSILEALGRAYFNSGQHERSRRDLQRAARARPVGPLRPLRARAEPQAAGPSERGADPPPAGRRAEPADIALPAGPRPPPEPEAGPTPAEPSWRRSTFGANCHGASAGPERIRAAAGSSVPRSRASQNSPMIDFASSISPRSAAATASRHGIRTRCSRSSSSGPSRSSSAGVSSVARYRCISSDVNPGAVQNRPSSCHDPAR